MDFVTVSKGLAACPLCLSRMLDPETRHKNNCKMLLFEDCVNWDIDATCGKLDFPAPKHYAESFLLGVLEKKLLLPKKINFETLQAALKRAIDAKVEDRWSDKNC